MIAFLGVGRMGAPMASNLARAGYEVVYHDPVLHPEAHRALTEAGAHRAEAPEALAAAELSISMLPDGASTEAALLGAAGLLDIVAPGHVHIAMGTIGTTATLRIAAAAAERGTTLIDAPVSGSVATAITAGLTAMVGAPDDVFTRVQPVLQTMTSRQLHTGPVGTGSAIKLAVNLVVGAVNEAIAESLLFAEGHGVARDIAYDAIEASVAGTEYARYKREVFLDPEHAAVAAPVSLVQKDLTLTVEEAARLRLPLPVVEASLAVLADATAAGMAGADMGAIIAHLQRRWPNGAA